MLVYLRDGSPQRVVRVATLRQELQINYLTQSHYTDTWLTSSGTDPIPPASGRITTGVPVF